MLKVCKTGFVKGHKLAERHTHSLFNQLLGRGRSGGASGTAVELCFSKPGSNPGTDLAFSELL